MYINMRQMISYSLLVALGTDSRDGNTGGGNPNAALRPRLTNLSPRRATTSFAFLVTLGSCESLRTKGINFWIVLAVSAATLLLFVAAAKEDAPFVPKRRPSFIVRCIAGVGSGRVSPRSFRTLVMPVVADDASDPACCSSHCLSLLFCNSSTNERRAFAAARSSLTAKAPAAFVMYITVSLPKLSASNTIWSAMSFSRLSPSLEMT
mmetsp:Transcript_19261/g.41756  ORF Transcript_19261/g.41756 Transcript_19261/m.41756 type:complete len:207 (+) Transcript_19261:909-1529(+)